MNVRRDCGFSLIEMLAVLAVMAIIAAATIPAFLGSLETMKLSASARDVHSEMQSARLKAVSANRPMRIRFNCPADGLFRVVELIGTPAAPDAQDTAADRCSTSRYPYPAASTSVLSRPNHDGPVRYLRAGVSFVSSQTIEFWPDGTAHTDAGTGTPWPRITGVVALSVQYKTSSRSITVNGVGKVQIQ